MTLSILAIAAFQFYWLEKAYEREERTLDMRTNFIFRETVRAVQASKLKLDRFGDSSRPQKIIIHEERDDRGKVRSMTPNQKIESMLDVVMNRVNDTNNNKVVFSSKMADSLRIMNRAFPGRRDRMLQFLFDLDSLQDSVKVRELDSAYQKHLEEQNLEIPYSISRVPTRETKNPVFNEVTLGFRNPITYRLDIEGRNSFVLKRIAIPILFSLFLVAFTALSFSLLYRNLLRQNRL
ncbi:MAG TPA: hypothetical protein VI385_12755, partial [Flavisolibacter sp.]